MNPVTHTLTIIIVLLFLVAQIVATVLIPVIWNRKGGGRHSTEELSEWMTYTIFAPVAAIVFSLFDGDVHALVNNYIVPWVLLSVLVIAVIVRVSEKRRRT